VCAAFASVFTPIGSKAEQKFPEKRLQRHAKPPQQFSESICSVIASSEPPLPFGETAEKVKNRELRE